MRRARKIRVLHLLGTAMPGGTESLVRDLLRHIGGAEQSLCILGESGSATGEYEELAAGVVILKSGERSTLRSISAYAWQIAGGRFDILHVHSGGRKEKAIARMLGCRHVITHFHSLTTMGVHLLRANNPAVGPLLGKMAEGSDRIFACSRWMTDVLSSRLPQHQGRINCIRNGVDLSRFAPTFGSNASSQMERERTGVPPGSVICGFVGRLVQQKGLLFLLGVARQIAAVAPEVMFLIVGDGPLLPVLRAHVRDWGLKNVIFTGAVRDVRPLMRGFDFLVVPSEWEPLGIVALEAMAMGKAVIASAVDGLPEVVVDGETGLLVPFGNIEQMTQAVLRVARDPAIRHAFGSRGRQRVEAGFDIRDTAAAIEKIYQLLVESS